jgi:tetratricopeptide (TPR) repeat protein
VGSPFDLFTRLEEDIEAALAEERAEDALHRAGEYCRLTPTPTPATAPVGDPWFRARYMAAQAALAAARPAAALAYARLVLPVAGGEPAARLRLFKVEALVRLGRLAEAREAFAQPPPGMLAGKAALRCRVACLRLALGQVAAMAEELAACAAALEGVGDHRNLALLLCEEGRAWDHAGDLPRAAACWRRAEALTRSLPPGPVRADALIQLGRLGHLRGDLPAALKTYDAASACASRAQAVEVELRRLLVRLDLGRWEQTRAAAARLLASAELPEELLPLANLVRALLEDVPPPADADAELLAYLAARRGDATAARSLYAAALAANPSPERRARLALGLGLVALNHKETDEARTWLRQAEVAARAHDLPGVLCRALQMVGQMAAEQDGDEELARHCFEEALLLREVQGAALDPIDRPADQERATVLRYLLRSACRRGDAAAVFRYQERERGRLLLELLPSARGLARDRWLDRPKFADVQARLADCERRLAELPRSGDGENTEHLLRKERQQLLMERDGLFEDFLRDRSRPGDGVLPALPELAGLQRSLPAGVLFVAPVVTEDELFLLAVDRGSAEVVRLPVTAAALGGQAEALRGCLRGQVARYRRGLLGTADRTDLDGRLEELGNGRLGEELFRLANSCRRLVWAPEGSLHGLPLSALRRSGRYLVETTEVAWQFSGALLVHQARGRRQVRGRFRPALVVAEAAHVLEGAAREADGVAASFLWARRLAGQAASRPRVRRWLRWAGAAHFACHADFEEGHPLAAAVLLPSGDKVHALEWLEEPVAGLPLVTLSACRGAEVGPLAGREVFGLVTGLLGGGVAAVLAGLWPIPDREVVPLMWCFYRHALTNDPAAALALAQRDWLARPEASPLFWAAFALHGDPDARPRPGPLGRWLAGLRCRWHARRFPS